MTEKNQNPKQIENKAMEKQKMVEKKPVATPKEKAQENKNAEEKNEEKIEKKKPEVKKVKKTEAAVNGRSLPISTKKSTAICKFINKKKVQRAISDLEAVLAHKRAVPMKGEIPHQKGKGMSSGGYPKKAIEHFIKLLKSLQANANENGLDEPVITEAMANMASRPYGKFGRVKKKRTHVQIKAREHRSVYPKLRNKGAKK